MKLKAVAFTVLAVLAVIVGDAVTYQFYLQQLSLAKEMGR